MKKDNSAEKHTAIIEDLLEAKWRLESVIEGTHAGIWEWNVQTGETVYNEIWAQIIGYTLNELAPVSINTWETLVHPDDLKQSTELLEKHFAGELPFYDMDCRMKHKDGHWVWVHDRGRVKTRTKEGKPLMMFGTHTDISERKRVERSLRESEERLRDITFSMADWVWEVDQNGVYTYSSQQSVDYFGPSRGNIIGKTPFDFMPHDEAKRVAAIFSEIVQNKAPIKDLENLNIGKNGEEICLLTNGVPILDEEGNLKGYRGVDKDITGSKKAETLVRQTQLNYETFFNTIDDFLFILDETGNILHANSTVYNRLGYTAEELFQKSVLLVHPPERREEAGRIVGEMLCGKAAFCPVPIITKTGVQIPVETRVSLGSWDGKPAIFGVTKDISRLKLSEEKFSKLFHLNPSACGLSELNSHQYVEVNEAFYSLLGFEKNEVIGRTTLELRILTPESISHILSGADINGIVTNVETELRAKNGDIKHVLMSAENIYIQDKRYRFTVVQDITELKHTEDILKESENSLQIAQKIGNMGSWVWDMVTQKTKWSENNFTILGFEPSEIDPSFEYFKSRIHPDDVSIFEQANTLLMKTKEPANFELRIIPSDGVIKWIQNNVIPVIQDNKIIKLTGVIIDITLRKQAEEELKQVYTRLALAARAGGVGVWDYDIVTNVLVWDDQMFKLYGIDEKNFSGAYEAWQAGVHPEDRARGDSEIQMAISGEKEFNTEFRVMWPDGAVKNIRALADVKRDHSGKPLHMIGTNWDITAQKNSEEALIKSKEELQKINAEKDKFYSIIAHDLRAPFNGFLGLTKIMTEELPTMRLDEIQKIALLIKNSATNLYGLLENLLDWSRMQRGITTFEPASFQLMSEISKNLTVIIASANKKEIGINIEIPEDLIVFADEYMLGGIIRNLIFNAIKFTQKGGTVTISAKSNPDNSAEISIKDTGIGMKRETINKLFQIGEQSGRKGTEGEPSTGLGLLLCKDFVDKQGGKIWAESEVGKGSTFSFTLPANPIPKIGEQKKTKHDHS